MKSEDIKLSIESNLLDISVVIEKELLRQCRNAGCDDQQTDTIVENTIAVFDLNKEKFIKWILEDIPIDSVVKYVNPADIFCGCGFRSVLMEDEYCDRCGKLLLKGK